MATAYGVSPKPMSSASSSAGGKIPVIVVAGPTASGKSALAVRIAETFGGEVVNADSMQVYHELEILTARPGPEDLARATHHLYGIRSLAEPCSAAAWLELAVAAIRDIHGRGRLAVVCGGTGFYIRALLEGLAEIPEIPPAVRAAATARHAELGGASFRAALADRDPLTADRLADGDTQRLIRAWEVAEATGRPLSAWQADGQRPVLDLAACTIALLPERTALYAACDGRFHEMIRRGALEEARRVAALGLDPGLPGMKALGLPELIRHLGGEMPLARAVELAQQATRRYAKRQTTWFRHQFVPKIPIGAQFSKSLEQEIFSKIRELLLTPSA
jgi:tRNA dimethylallyltransferase